MPLVLIGVILGEAVLVFEAINRLFGSYSRTLTGTAARLALALPPVLLLPAPALIYHVFELRTDAVWVLCMVTGVVGWLTVLHFLVPYKWGVRRVRESHHEHDVRPLSEKIVLQDCHLHMEGLPEGCDRLAVVALSDLHCTTDERLRTLTDALQKLDEEELFDLVLVLGDLGEDSDRLPEVMRALGAVRTRYGVFCVRGNHDFEKGRAALVAHLAQRHGVRLLANEFHDVPGTGLTLVGLELPWDKAPLPDPVCDRFVIGLGHTPDNILHFERLGVDLGFVGHTHGGRVKIPRLGSVFVPGLLGRFMERGLFRRGSTRMYVTAGVGYYLAELGKRGEMLRVHLMRQQEEAETSNGREQGHSGEE